MTCSVWDIHRQRHDVPPNKNTPDARDVLNYVYSTGPSLCSSKIALLAGVVVVVVTMRQPLVTGFGVDLYARTGKCAVFAQHNNATLVRNVPLHKILFRADTVSHCLDFPNRRMHMIEFRRPKCTHAHTRLAGWQRRMALRMLQEAVLVKDD